MKNMIKVIKPTYQVFLNEANDWVNKLSSLLDLASQFDKLNMQFSDNIDVFYSLREEFLAKMELGKVEYMEDYLKFKNLTETPLSRYKSAYRSFRSDYTQLEQLASQFKSRLGVTKKYGESFAEKYESLLSNNERAQEIFSRAIFLTDKLETANFIIDEDFASSKTLYQVARTKYKDDELKFTSTKSYVIESTAKVQSK